MDKALAIQKRCSDCLEFKNQKDYTKHGPSQDGLLNVCRMCVSARRLLKKEKLLAVWNAQTSEIKKLCTKCHSEKPITRFHKCVSNRDGRENSCLDCRNYSITKAHKKLMESMSEEEQFTYKKSIRIHRKYKMSIDEFNDRIKFQDNKCAICFIDFSHSSKIYIDHDHACCAGEWSCGMCNRGLLCKKCNWGLGMFNDSPDIIHSAMLYIERWNNGILNISH